jgi:hypothetical protein
MRMSELDDETPEVLVARVGLYAPVFHRALRGAIETARAYFRRAGGAARPFEPWLFAHLVRYELKQRLCDSLPPGTPISIDGDTIMSSVVVHLTDLEIRVRKSAPGEVPPPGPSERMLGWYAQTLDGGVAHNLLMLWHVDEGLSYAGVDIAFPYGGTAYAPLVRWVVPLADVVSGADDLDITLPPDAEEGGRDTGTS